MESLLSLFGGGGGAAAGAGAGGAGLSYLGGGSVDPNSVTPATSPGSFGPAQGGPTFGQTMGNIGTQLLNQKTQVGGGGGGGGGGAGAGAGAGGMNASGGYMGGHL